VRIGLLSSWLVSVSRGVFQSRLIIELPPPRETFVVVYAHADELRGDDPLKCLRLTGGAVSVTIASFKCFKLRVFLSSSSWSSLGIWMEDWRDVNDLFRAPLGRACDEVRRKGQDAIFTAARLRPHLCFIADSLFTIKPSGNKSAHHHLDINSSRVLWDPDGRTTLG
jgi:hypothetical protein